MTDEDPVRTHQFFINWDNPVTIEPEHDDSVLLMINIQCYECKLEVPIPINDTFLNHIISENDFDIGMPPDYDQEELSKTCEEHVKAKKEWDEKQYANLRALVNNPYTLEEIEISVWKAFVNNHGIVDKENAHLLSFLQLSSAKLSDVLSSNEKADIQEFINKLEQSRYPENFSGVLK